MKWHICASHFECESFRTDTLDVPMYVRTCDAPGETDFVYNSLQVSSGSPKSHARGAKARSARAKTKLYSLRLQIKMHVHGYFDPIFLGKREETETDFTGRLGDFAAFSYNLSHIEVARVLRTVW